MQLSVRPLAIALLGASFLLLNPAASEAKKQYVTGKCVCKKGGNVKDTYSAKICTTADHDGCTAAKDRCVSANQAACTNLGGILTHSGASCTYGAKC